MLPKLSLDSSGHGSNTNSLLNIELEQGDNGKRKKRRNSGRGSIQDDIQFCITPSGRKLCVYGSESGEEVGFKRTQCRQDPDFDLLQPYIQVKGKKGIWPNPYLYYWNWKRTDEDVDAHIKASMKKYEHKGKIALELEQSPTKVPHHRIGADDTDESSSDDAKDLKATHHQIPHSLKVIFSEIRKPVMDPLLRRYPHLHLHLQGACYSKCYQFRRMHQAHKRKWHEVLLRIIGKYHNGCCLMPYPLWYLAWKKCIRFGVALVPRKWKFLKEKKTETVFYGTMASLFATQYIVEYDMLPNMDDPVLMSQIALQKSLELKEQFLFKPKDGRKPYVDYITMQRSKSYEEYLDCIGLLCRYQPAKMIPRVRKVFFINYFNVLSIQTQIRRIPEVENMKYLWEMDHFWEKSKGLAGYLELSLDEIYHGILRCNRIHPFKQAHVFGEEQHGPAFPKEMSPTRLSLDWFDPRIHFALNVGTKSCPPIQIFSLYEQDCQLEEVATTYIRSRVKIEEESRTVTLPSLFLWYEKDFGNNQRVLLWYLKRYLLAKDTLKIRQMVTSTRSILFCYESPDDELEPCVVRHPPSECRHVKLHKKIIPAYWGHRF